VPLPASTWAMAEEPLTPTQRIAASRLAAGEEQQAIAASIGVHANTIARWKQREDFRDLVRRNREGLMPETPTAEAVLTAALSATRPDGSPDWQNRIAAAKAILSTPVTSDEAQEQASRVERIYVSPDEGVGEDA
jgi:hypothetical protein